MVVTLLLALSWKYPVVNADGGVCLEGRVCEVAITLRKFLLVI